MKKTLLIVSVAVAVVGGAGTKPIIMDMEGTPPLRGVP